MSDCIFCKIINKEIPGEIIYESDEVLAFMDISPKAPFHAVVIPKIHIRNLSGIDATNSKYIQKIFEAIPIIADKHGLNKGYRLISNCGEYGGQTVSHLHFHILGKVQMSDELVIIK